MTKKKKTIILVALIAVVALIGFTYAYWLITRTQTNTNVITAKCLDISLSNESNDISLSEAYPISDADGMQTTPYQFTISNNCNNAISYQVALESVGSAATAMQASSIKAVLDNGTPRKLNHYTTVDTTIDGAYDAHRLGSGTLAASGSEGSSKTYSLRLWIDEFAPVEENGKSFSAKIAVTIGQGINNTDFATITAAYTAAVQTAINNAQDSIDGDYYIAANGNLQNVRTGDLSSTDINETVAITPTAEVPHNGFIKIEGGAIVATQYSEEDPICRYIEDYRPYKPSKPAPNETGGETNGIHSIRKGAKYECQVNDTDSYTFYVISNNDTASNGNDNFDLILANDSLTTTSAWGNTINEGPATAMEAVMALTNDWANIPYNNFNSNVYSKWSSLTNSGYASSSVGYRSLTVTDGAVAITDNSGNTTNLPGKARARLLSYQEANYVGCSFETNSCYSWLVDSNKIFYLLDNASVGNPMFVSGYRRLGGPDDPTEKYYIAPVISLPKTAMDWANKVRAN